MKYMTGVALLAVIAARRTERPQRAARCRRRLRWNNVRNILPGPLRGAVDLRTPQRQRESCSAERLPARCIS
jgi:hypothetical protein